MPRQGLLRGLRAHECGADDRHGFTYSGHPVSAAAALAVLDIFERENLVERAAEMGRISARSWTSFTGTRSSATSAAWGC